MTPDLFADERAELERPYQAPAPPLARPGPMAHHADPPTSHVAADMKRASPTLGEDQRLALQLVRSWPGRTCLELAETYYATARDPEGDAGLEYHRQRIGRRLSELAATCEFGHAGGDQLMTEHSPAGIEGAEGEGPCLECECPRFRALIVRRGERTGPYGRPASLWWPGEGGV